MGYTTVTYTFTNSTTADATQVNQNFTDIINGTSDGTKNFNISALTAAGSTILNGNMTFGASSSNTMTFNGSIASSIPIGTNTSYDLGSATLGIRSVYIGASSTNTVRILGGSGSTYTLTLPGAVPAGNAYALESTTGGVLSFANRRIAPTIQKFTSGSGTYTTVVGALYIKLKMIGGGGGASGSSTSGATNGGSGGNTTFGTNTAGGGSGGAFGGSQAGGGTATFSLGIGTALTGSDGTVGGGFGAAAGVNGPPGGGSPFGGAGGGGYQAGSAAYANSGSGGGGAGNNGTVSVGCGNSGASGAYIECIISSPAASYSYGVGAAGTAGAAGTSGFNGGAGGSGYIEVTEYYQ